MPELKALPPLRRSNPKYLRIAEQVRTQIHAGVYCPGDKLPRVADWKRELGVSLDTMDRVLTVLEQDGLIERTQGSGVYVAVRPKETRSGGTGIIGVLGLGHEGELNSYWNHLLLGAQGAAQAAGLHLMLLDDDKSQWERVDGVLSMGNSGSAAVERRPEMMCAVSLLTVSKNAPYLEVDDYAGVAAIMQHLLELGHRKIAYLHTPGETDRLAAYRQAMTDYTTDERWLRVLYEVGSFSLDLSFSGHAFAAMQKWLREDWRELGCTALLAHNDEAAIGVLKALWAAGIDVPSQVSVVGFDGTELAAHADPPLTTLEVPLEAIGARGVELLLRQMQGEVIDEPFTVGGQLKIRESTAPPRN